MADSEIVTAIKEGGRWVKGTSGNPAGRPISDKDKILASKQKLEQFVRGKISPEKVVKIVEQLLHSAAKGDTAAAKVILPYILSKASDGSEDADRGERGGIVFRIENATIKPQRQVIAVEAEVISDG